MGTIYGLTCACHPSDGIRYVGQTAQKPSRRLAGHRGMAVHARNRGLRLSHLQRWILKHGPEQIKMVELESAPVESLNARESHWIEALKSNGTKLVNVGPGGDAVWRGGKRPDQSARMLGAGNPMHGKKRADEMAHARSFQGELKESTRAKYSARSRGEGNPRAQLTASDVLEIRQLAATTSLSQLARDYGVTAQSIWSIVHRKTWAHVA